MLAVLAWFTGLTIIGWSLLPLVRHGVWWVRAFDFPRVQLALLTLLAMAGCVVALGGDTRAEQLLIAALLGCVLFQLWHIVPYTPLWAVQLRDCPQARADRVVSLLVANVLTSNRNAAGLLAMVRAHRPDVVLTVETDQWWEEQLDALAADYPHAVRHPLDNLYGMHLYSRLPLIDPEVLFLVEPGVPSIHAHVLLPCGQQVELHCLHPAPPSPTENLTSAERDAELLMVARNIDTTRGPVVVMGDLNDVAWSHTTRLFQRLSGLLDPRIGRGTFNTFHARYPFLRWPLDHVFCSPDFTLVRLARLPAFGSDHFPMLATLCHEPTAGTAHDAPQPQPADHDDAQARIDQVDNNEAALQRRR